MQQCLKCVLDESVPELDLDIDGVCYYCRTFESQIRPKIAKFHSQGEEFLSGLKDKLKNEAKGKYDAILGLSGGVDSSYTALLAKRLGLNPLIVHFDNSWNSETSISNIKKIVEYCGFDLHTYVIHWPEFRDLQRSFFKAGVLDIEMLTDHAIIAILYHLTKKFGTKNVLSGNNYATEYGMPVSWSWNKLDYRNIKSIHRKYGEKRLKTFPILPTWRWILINRLNVGVNFVEPLNYIPYRKDKALEEMKEAFDWVYYGEKHYESTFTKFYQAYFLPQKFGIDKRKAHYSSLIRNGEFSREEVIEKLNTPLWREDELRNEKAYVLKKLGFSEAEFEEIMAGPARQHTDFPSDKDYLDPLRKCFRVLKGVYNG